MALSQLERNNLIAEGKRLLDKKPFTKEDSARYDRIMDLVDRNTNFEPYALARIATLEDSLGIPRTPYDDAEARASFRKFIVTGEMDNSIRATAQTTTNVQGGGALIPQLFFQDLIAVMKQYDRLFDPDVVTVVPTDSGAPMPYPLLDDVSQSATIIDENVISVKTTPLTFAQMLLANAPTWRSGWIVAPIQLIQDSAVPIESMLISALGVRIARGVGANIVSTLQSSALTYSTAAGQTQSVVGDDLFNLMSSVNPAYLASPKCGFAMNYSTAISVLKLKDTAGRYLFHLKYDGNGNPMLLEKPLFICPSMPSPGAGNTPIAFGDFGRLVVRMVKNSQMLIRSSEAPGTGDQLAVGFQGYLRCNAGLLLDTSQSPADTPIHLLKNAAA